MKKKILAASLIVAMLAVAVIGGSLAYFTDNDDNLNTFTYGNVDITLDETDAANPEGDRVKANIYENLTPGAHLVKDPTVHNVGHSPAYIRATVKVSDWCNLCDVWFPEAYPGTMSNAEFKNSLNLLIDELGEGWSIIGVTGQFVLGEPLSPVFYLKYDSVLEPGKSTSPIFTEFIIPTAMENGQDTLSEVVVEAQAIQSDNFADWDAAFTAFDAK